MRKNLTLAVLFALSSLAACGSTGTVRTTESNHSSGVTATSAEGASTAVAVDGFAFSPPAGDYSVVFPDEPTANEQIVPLADGGSVPMTMYASTTASTAFVTAAVTGQPGTVMSLEVARDGALANANATLRSSEPITLQGRAGLQFAGDMQSGQATVLARIYADDVTLYQSLVVVPGEVAFDDPKVAAFLDSFRFTVDK